MASFTDAIPQFNPYIQQLPVEAMVTVGMEKQQRYDQGVQRIQSQIDQVAGLDIYRPEDKQLMQSKLNELGSKLKTVAAGDFSNYQLVNSVAGMAGTLMKDPTIIAAVQSTQNIKNNSKIMEEARQKGELTPDNELRYRKNLSAYENSGLVDERGNPIVFNAKYDPHFDVFKFVKENFDAVKPANLTFSQVYETDTQGNPLIDPATNKPIYSPVMKKLQKEGRLPEAVSQTLDQIFSDPRVSKQLQITGEYNYQSYTPDMLKQKISNQENTIMAAQNSKIAELTLIKTNAKTQEEKDLIDIQIGNIQSSIDKGKEQYTKLKQGADTNPDAIKGLLYEDDVRSRYTTMFGQMSITETIESNAGWEANYKMQQAAQQRIEFYERLSFDKQKHKDDIYYKELELAQKAAEAAAKNGGKQWELSDMPGEYDIVANFNQEYDSASEDFVNSSGEFIYNGLYKYVPGADARFQKLIQAGNTREKAIDIILKQDAEKQGISDIEFRTKWGDRTTQSINRNGAIVNEELQNAFSLYNVSKKGLEDIQFIKDKHDGISALQTDQSILNLMSGDQIKPQTVKFRGNDVQLSKQNVIDIAAYVAGNKHIFGFAIDEGVRKAADAAYKRLDREGKANLADYMLRTTAVGEAKRDTGDGLFATAQQIIGAPLVFGSNALGGVSAIARTIGSLVTSPIQTLKDDWSAIVGDTDFDKTQVEKAFDIMNVDKYSQGLSAQAENLKKFYNVSPNAKAAIFTGNAEADRKILSDIKGLAGAYKAADQNLSGTFDEFSTLINSKTDANDLNLEVKSYPIGGGRAQFQIVGYDEDGKEVAMTIQPDEARRFNLTSPYVSNSVSILENRINSNGGQTSYGSADVKQTYINGDAYFQKVDRDFPGLLDSPYNVMANITNSNGMYYGKIFVQDPATGTSAPIFTTPGGDLETIYNSLRSMDNNFVRSIISNK
jgi:hypothetical protein